MTRVVAVAVGEGTDDQAPGNQRPATEVGVLTLGLVFAEVMSWASSTSHLSTQQQQQDVHFPGPQSAPRHDFFEAPGTQHAIPHLKLHPLLASLSRKLHLWENVVLGGTSAAIAGTLVFPMDTIKTRLMNGVCMLCCVCVCACEHVRSAYMHTCIHTLCVEDMWLFLSL